MRRALIQEGYRKAETQTSEFQAYRLATLMADALAGKDVMSWGLDIDRAG